MNYEKLVRGCYFASGGRVAMLEKLFSRVMPPFGSPEVLTEQLLHHIYERSFAQASTLFNPFSVYPL